MSRLQHFSPAYTDVWGFHIIFFSLQNGQKNKYPSICPRILLICFNESCRVCSFKSVLKLLAVLFEKITQPEALETNSVRDIVFSEISVDVLNADDGVTKLIEFLDKLFKKDELSEAYETYVAFDRFRRSKVSSLEDYVIEFEKLYNKTKKFKMELPQTVLAFKLLECSDLEMKYRQLVLTDVCLFDLILYVPSTLFQL